MIDMEAAEETLRSTRDEIETLRDSSHVKNLSKAEIKHLFTAHNLPIENAKQQKCPSAWNIGFP